MLSRRLAQMDYQQRHRVGEMPRFPADFGPRGRYDGAITPPSILPCQFNEIWRVADYARLLARREAYWCGRMSHSLADVTTSSAAKFAACLRCAALWSIEWMRDYCPRQHRQSASNARHEDYTPISKAIGGVWRHAHCTDFTPLTRLAITRQAVVGRHHHRRATFLKKLACAAMSYRLGPIRPIR